MKLKPVPSLRRGNLRAGTASAESDAAEPRIVAETGADGAPRILEHGASDVRGVIDNATTDRLYGWAWDAAHPGARLKVGSGWPARSSPTPSPTSCARTSPRAGSAMAATPSSSPSSRRGSSARTS